MAEAHAAVRVYEENRRGIKLLVSDEGIEVSFVIPPPRELKARALRYAFHLKRTVHRFVYPAPPAVAVNVVILVIAIVLYSPSDSWWRNSTVSWAVWRIGNSVIPFTAYIPHSLYVAYLAAWTAFFGFMILMSLHRLLLRGLLSYHGWLYLAPKQTSYVVTAWAGLLKLLGGKNPLTYSYQSALPRMSVPALKDTVDRYLQSIHPLVSEEEYQRISTLASEFVSSDGPRLQKYLVLKSWWANNYISDWWEQYVYLKGRTSLMINSNYYALPSRSYIPSKNPLARAASLTHQLMLLKQKLDREQLPPLMLRNLVPMCMQQYTRIFSTTRIPGREEDQLKKYDTSKHIAVSCKGRWFKMPLFRKGTHGALLSAYDMQRQFESIAAAAAQGKTVVDEHELALLTTANRTTWASHRDTFFSEGVNKKSLHVIESAVFVVILDDTAPESVDDIGRSLIHGSGSNRWFDKSFNLVVYAHGKAGLNVEHSWADAPVVAHVWEEVLSREIIDRTFDAVGHCKKVESSPESKSSGTGIRTDPVNNVQSLPAVEQLQWQWSPALQLAIDSERVLALKAIGDFDLRVISHTAFGKAVITKQCKMSPDAFIQMALQYAYYKNSHGTFTQTYEASMTRLFKHGRTETVRPVTDASKAFILSLVDPKVDKKTRRELGWVAGEAHQDLYRKAMSGQGVDRHLFTLYCVSVGMGIESSFLKDALQRPWRLSTSQQPQQQTNNGKTLATIIDDMESFWCPGGGFGPVAEDGYGVSYMIAGDSNLFFHISSNLSAPNTSSTKFADDLFEALKEIRAVWEDEK